MWEAAGSYPKEFKEGLCKMVDLIMHSTGGNNFTLVWIVEMNVASSVACVHTIEVTLNLDSNEQQ